MTSSFCPCTQATSTTIFHHPHPPSLKQPTQIEEEAGIPRSRLRLACVGRPLPVRDGGRRFLVHPLLFDAAGDDAAAATTAAAAVAAAARSGGDGGDGGNGAGGGEAAPVGVDAMAAGSDPPVALNWENTEARWVTRRCARAASPSLPALLA